MASISIGAWLMASVGGCGLWAVFGPMILISLPEEESSLGVFNVLISEFVMPTEFVMLSLFLQAQFSHHPWTLISTQHLRYERWELQHHLCRSNSRSTLSCDNLLEVKSKGQIQKYFKM